MSLSEKDRRDKRIQPGDNKKAKVGDDKRPDQNPNSRRGPGSSFIQNKRV